MRYSSAVSIHSAHVWPETGLAPVLIIVILLATVGTTILFLGGALAYARRRHLRYLLITLALGALVARSIFGLGTVFGYVPMPVHHLVEHGLDLTIAVLVLYAVYRSGPTAATNLEPDE